MRFFWFHSSSRTAAFAPSAALSVAAHAALFGAVAYGRGPLAPLLEELTVPRIYYLPPPDRMPRREATAERIQFVDVGLGRVRGGLSPTDVRDARPTGEELSSPGRAAGIKAERQMATAPIESSDSVYSVLSEQETAIRVEGSAAPVYPAELILAGVEGSVQTQYVIDTSGRADSASLQVLAATHPAFVRAVREAVPGMRFTPAIVQGRKVRQMVAQRFDFRLAAPAAVPPVGAPAEHTRTTPVP